MTPKKLVRGGWVIPGPTDPPLRDGAVLVAGAQVAAVGRFEDLQVQHRDATVVGSDSMAVIPGLINAHHHSHGTTTIQHGIPDDLLEPWILSFAPMRRGDTYLNTLLSCARQLQSGVTTVVDVHSAVGSAEAFAGSVDAGLHAYDKSGLRVAFAAGQTLQSLLIHGPEEDRAFLRSLPAGLRKRTDALLRSADRMNAAEYLEVVETRIRAYADHSRVDVWFGPPGPQWVPEDLLSEIAERAAHLDTNIQTHCVESHYEMLHGLRTYGKPTVEYLADLGVLDERFSLAHGVWLKRSEIDVLAETGAAVSHNPSSNLRLRSGVAPLTAMLDAGVTVGLGMDGTTLNEDEDMFTEMRLALRLQRAPQLSRAVPTPQSVLELATTGGARLMRKSDQIGRLANGYQADMVLVDLSRVRWPWVAPEFDPLDLVLLQVRAGDVHTVLVDGEIVLERGKPTKFHVQEIGRALAESLQRQAYDHGKAKLAAELKPRLETWYRAWEDGDLKPYIHYNSEQ